MERIPLTRTTQNINHIYYTYVLQSLKDHKLYIGFTRHIYRRLNKHLSGDVPATSRRWPLRLLYFEACYTKEDALARERYFKTSAGEIYLQNRLKMYFIKYSCDVS